MTSIMEQKDMNFTNVSKKLVEEALRKEKIENEKVIEWLMNDLWNRVEKVL